MKPHQIVLWRFRPVHLQGLSFLFLVMAQITIKYITKLFCACSKMPRENLRGASEQLQLPSWPPVASALQGLFKAGKQGLDLNPFSVEVYGSSQACQVFSLTSIPGSANKTTLNKPA
jgi:hypothetical protein